MYTGTHIHTCTQAYTYTHTCTRFPSAYDKSLFYCDKKTKQKQRVREKRYIKIESESPNPSRKAVKQWWRPWKQEHVDAVWNGWMDDRWWRGER
jgi:hypothetical protein